MNPNYLKDINFLEEPLVGLNLKLHNVELRSLMSDEELRAWVQTVRTLRENRMTFKSQVERGSKAKTETKQSQKAEKLFGEFGE